MVEGRGAAGPMKRQNMDGTLNTGNESAPFAPKSYSTSSNLQHTHTHKNPPTFCASSDLFGWL